MLFLRLTLLSGLIVHKLLWEFLKRKEGSSEGHYRPPGSQDKWLFKLIKATVLIFLVVQTLFLDLFPICEDHIVIRVIGTSLYFIGLATAMAGRIQLGKNWADLEDYQVLTKQSLVTTGIYRYIRHPIYIGDILLLLGLELALNSWLVVLVSIPFLIVIRQALAEEALLSDAFPNYDAYRRQTKRFIPFVV